MRRRGSGGPIRVVAYWTLTGLLIGFGMLGILSIGLPFLILGATLAILGPLRSNRVAFWSGLTGVIVFIAVAVLLSPWGCTTQAVVQTVPGTSVDMGTTSCMSPIGIEYSGDEGYSPNLALPLLAGLGVGLISGRAISTLLRRRMNA